MLCQFKRYREEEGMCCCMMLSEKGGICIYFDGKVEDEEGETSKFEGEQVQSEDSFT
jgi:hypothetical protein